MPSALYALQTQGGGKSRCFKRIFSPATHHCICYSNKGGVKVGLFQRNDLPFSQRCNILQYKENRPHFKINPLQTKKQPKNHSGLLFVGLKFYFGQAMLFVGTLLSIWFAQWKLPRPFTQPLPWKTIVAEKCAR